MKYNTFENGGNVEGRVSVNGLIMTGKLKLQREASEPNEAVNKGFVDNAATNLDASKIVTGTMPVERFPGLTGDVISVAGSGILSLKNTGVIPGTYTKVTVNNSGLVTSGGSLDESDIPNFGWEKITSGRPTTLAGYGITNAVNRNDGVVNGNITLSADPVAGDDVVTKRYADNALNGRVGFAVGDIVGHSGTVVPDGFLRCNGGEVSKTTYAALYAVVGDQFGGIVKGGSGQPWKQQYDINTTQTDALGTWTTGTAIPAIRNWASAFVTKNRAYLLGGRTTGSTAVNTVYTAPIFTDGTLGAWTTGTAFPINIYGTQVLITNNRIYVIGGFNGTAAISTIYTASINADGTIGTWVTAGNIPVTLQYTHSIITRNRVYLLGGHTGAALSNVIYTAPINANGTLGTWTTAGNLPAAIFASNAIVIKSQVYLLGGSLDFSTGVSTSNVYTAPINTDGTLGSWTTGPSLPATLAYSQVFVTRNRVYITGGGQNSGASSSSVVYHAPINVDGTLGTWSTGTALVVPLSRSQLIATSTRLYLLGGWTTTAVATVYTIPIVGGLNDYSPYYDGTFETVSSSANFRIPDYSTRVNPNTQYIIKF